MQLLMHMGPSITSMISPSEISLGSFEKLNDGGKYYAVIQKKQGAESLYKALQTVFPIVEVIEKDKGYWIIKAEKN